MRRTIRGRASTMLFAFCVVALAGADEPGTSYAAPTSFDEFRFADRSEEIALARSAAPPSIAGDAEILTLGSQRYETAVKGKNGFVCLVQRSWANTFDNGEFWNPKIRAPICFNPAAARSLLPFYLDRTQWVLSGVPKPEMVARTRAAISAHAFADPEPDSMSYMMSRQGYINDRGHHWYAHVMFFMPRVAGANWGANSPGVPIFSDDSDPRPITVFFVLVPKWSDGSLVFPDKT